MRWGGAIAKQMHHWHQSTPVRYEVAPRIYTLIAAPTAMKPTARRHLSEVAVDGVIYCKRIEILCHKMSYVSSKSCRWNGFQDCYFNSLRKRVNREYFLCIEGFTATKNKPGYHHECGTWGGMWNLGVEPGETTALLSSCSILGYV